MEKRAEQFGRASRRLIPFLQDAVAGRSGDGIFMT
jgi:hypothetical protein